MTKPSPECDHRCTEKGETLPMADHDEISRKVLDQPWEIQKAIVTIAAHCTAIRDNCPTGDVADLAACISHCCDELASALPSPPAHQENSPRSAPEPAPQAREALEPFAKAADYYDEANLGPGEHRWRDDHPANQTFKVGQLRAARAALSIKGTADEKAIRPTRE